MPSKRKYTATGEFNAETKTVLPIDVQKHDHLVMHETDETYLWMHVVEVDHDACSSHDTHVSVKSDPQNPQEHPRQLCLIKCAPQKVLV